jgi:hypothetical protein
MRIRNITLQTRLFVLGCILFTGQMAFGQTFGAIGGDARDTTGAAITGASVTAVNVGTNASRTVVTSAHVSCVVRPVLRTLRRRR